ncbi:MAG: acetyl-CoA carboxylase, biotin carboxyl carrier protein [Holosporales bacterium]|jgi:acetyl-CoA carboxylase biotin carboxyl carrier protein|nr:acetyl-CoA carboxylase, biotin carboxyl carrier protein [Holosporales bacterium]
MSKIDEEAIRALARLLEETALSEIEYQTEAFKIRVAKSLPVATTLPASPQKISTIPEPSAGVSEDHPANIITSPMVGTVYLSSAPGAPPMIHVGDTVKEGQPLMIVEAMKVLNTIRAPREGHVKRLCVTDGQPVEFGEPLLVLS